MTSPLDIDTLMSARERTLCEMLKELRLFSRRAKEPEDRVALAEIERELLEVRRRWEKNGLIAEHELEEAFV